MSARESARFWLSLFLAASLASCSVDLDDLTSGSRDASSSTGSAGQGGSTASGGSAGTETGGAGNGGSGGAGEVGGVAGAGAVGGTGGTIVDASHEGGGGVAGASAGTAGSGGGGNRPDAAVDAVAADTPDDDEGTGGAGGEAGAGGAAGSSGADDGGGDAVFDVASDTPGAHDAKDAGPLCQGSCKRVFVTANPPPGKGAFGGLTAADSFCQSAADAHQLGGSWKAWLSDASTSASARLAHAAVPYVSLDGSEIAANWTALTSGALTHAIDVSEDGTVHPNTEVWTGTSSTGSYTGRSCSAWSSASKSSTADVGRTDQTSSAWTSIFFQECDRSNVHLYCIEQ